MSITRVLSWPEVLAALRSSTASTTIIRDGRETTPAGDVRTRPAAKGTDICLYSGGTPATRLDLIERLEKFQKGAGRRFMSSARASINDTTLLVESVADETIDGVLVTVIDTRRPTLGFNRSQQVGSTTTLRSKRIKTG
jgi:hypothetical protein